MTALSLSQIVADGLARIGIDPSRDNIPKGRPRVTTWFGSEHGFGVRHYAGGRQVYIAQTRMGGRLRTVTIGSTVLLTEHQARTVAQRVIAASLLGHDPATTRARRRSAPRYVDFLDEYWRRCAPGWKPSTRITHDKYRRLYLDKAFPDSFIDELDEAQLTPWFARLSVEAGPGGANRVLSILNSMLNKAESWGYRLENSNPCRAIRPNRRRTCERFLSETELQRLGNVLADDRASGDDMKSLIANAVALILLTGCRVSEILGLQWEDVRGHRLKLRDSKTEPRTVWLGDDACAIIDTLPRRRNIAWLFWNPRSCKPFLDIHARWYELRKRAGLPGVRLHDLRHTFASHAVRSKETLTMVGHLLGHQHVQSTARYAHLSDDDLLSAAEHIGNIVERLLN
jgi:integrase